MIGVSNSKARTATQLLKLTLYKTKVITHALQPRDPSSRVHFFSWFLQSVVEGEIEPQLTFFSDEVWLHLQGYINTQNNRYWSSRNPHLTHEVPLHPMKDGCLVCSQCKKDFWTCFFNETINCENIDV
jgi:hypothetical protein